MPMIPDYMKKGGKRAIMKYKFKAKELKTGKWVEGDLVYARTMREKVKIKPMIVTIGIHGGMVWVRNRYFIDENTIELIKGE